MQFSVEFFIWQILVNTLYLVRTIYSSNTQSPLLIFICSIYVRKNYRKKLQFISVRPGRIYPIALGKVSLILTFTLN